MFLSWIAFGKYMTEKWVYVINGDVGFNCLLGEVLQVMLPKINIQVDYFDTAKDGFDAVKAKVPNVVVVNPYIAPGDGDFIVGNYPNETGSDLVDKIRKVDKNVPILVLKNPLDCYPNSGSLIGFKSNGVTEFISVGVGVDFTRYYEIMSKYLS